MALYQLGDKPLSVIIWTNDGWFPDAHVHASLGPIELIKPTRNFLLYFTYMVNQAEWHKIIFGLRIKTPYMTWFILRGIIFSLVL